jgi:hypothetical protein
MTYESLWNELNKACEASTLGYASVKNGDFCLYGIPVGQRTTWRKKHLRITHYLLVNGEWQRVSKETFLARLKDLA